LTVFDGEYFSTVDAVQISAINAAPPEAVDDLAIAINAGSIDLSWSEITFDTDGILTQMAGYIIYRGTSAYFTPQPADSIGVTDELTFFFTDNNLNGAMLLAISTISISIRWLLLICMETDRRPQIESANMIIQLLQRPRLIII